MIMNENKRINFHQRTTTTVEKVMELYVILNSYFHGCSVMIVYVMKIYNGKYVAGGKQNCCVFSVEVFFNRSNSSSS
jgi:hypothetical protein